MSILLVPSQYETIQGAIDAAKCNDKIEISPGLYQESIVISTNSIKLFTKGRVTIQGIGAPGIIPVGVGITIQANNVTIYGLSIQGWDVGISIIGNNNKIIKSPININTLGVQCNGNYNLFESSSMSTNTTLGIIINGSYNQVVACRINANQRGINLNSDSGTGNVMYKNFIINNQVIGIRVSNPRADKTVIRECTISDSQYGIVCDFGRAAIVCNRITNILDDGIVYKGNNGLILENSLGRCGTGMYLYTCNSLIAGNTVIQTGNRSGVVIFGRDNTIVRNYISFTSNTGLAVVGCCNTICNNDVLDNGVNVEINGVNNYTDCNEEYCAQIGCSPVKRYLDLLKIFDHPKNYFLIGPCNK